MIPALSVHMSTHACTHTYKHIHTCARTHTEQCAGLQAVALDFLCAHLSVCVYIGGGTLVYIKTMGGYGKVRSRSQETRSLFGLTRSSATPSVNQGHLPYLTCLKGCHQDKGTMMEHTKNTETHMQH